MTEAAAPGVQPDNAATASAEPQAPAVPDKPTGEATDWREGFLPEDLLDDPNFTKYDTKEGFLKSHLSLVKMLGSEKVPIPREGDEEGWQRFYKAAGHPERPEDYGFSKPEEIPEGLTYNEDLDKQIATILHGAHLNRNQAMKVREELMGLVGKGAIDGIEAQKQQQAEYEAAIQKAEETLRQEWGPAFESRGKIAGAAINKFLSPETIAAMDAAGIANNPAIVKDMYNLGVKLAGEKELINADGQLDSPADLESQIADFRAKHSSALFDRSHPDHAQRTKEYTRLFERRYGESA